MAETSGSDKKVMFISLGILCIVFLGVTAFVWSSVNRRNQELTNSVASLQSQLRTLKNSMAEKTPDQRQNRRVESLSNEVRCLAARLGKVEARSKGAERSLEELRQNARETLAFQKKLVEFLELQKRQKVK